MKEYLITAFVATLIAGICVSLSHEGYRRVSATAAGVIVVSVLIAPLINMGEGIADFFGGETYFPDGELSNGYFETAEDAFCQGVSKAISEKFSVDAECVTVRTEGFVPEKMRAEKINILLVGRAVISDLTAVRRFAEESFLLEGGVCRVEIEIG